MTVKTTLHAQGWDPWLQEYLAASGAQWIKFVNWFVVLPGINIIGRVHVPESESDAMISRGEAGAVEFYNRVRPEMEKARHVAIWEGPNEPSIWNAGVLNGLVPFYQKLIQLYHGGGFAILAGQFNTGWPLLPSDDGGTQSAICGRAVQGADGVSFHEYDPQDLRRAWGYTTGRYKKTAGYWRSIGLQVPPVFITELGLDRPDPAAPLGHWGWRHITKDEQHPNGNLELYIEQLCWYEAQIQADPQVQAATVFSVLTNWTDFALDRAQSLALAAELVKVNPTPPPPPERAKGLYLSKYQDGTTRASLQALWDSGQRAIGFRVTGPNDPDNPTYTEVDKIFLKWYPVAKEMGFLTYGFHYLHPALNEQAKVFAQAVEGLTFEMGLYGDLEHTGLDANRCARFFKAADRETRQTVHVYGRKSQLDAWRVSTEPGYELWQEGRRLWLAAWTYDLSVTPILPKTWENVGYELHQWNNKGELPMADPPERVCLDVWRGTTQEMLDEYGTPDDGGEVEVGEIRVFDKDGNQKDWAWALDQFGPMDLRLAEPSVQADGTSQKVALVEAREQFGPANLNVQLLDINGAPVAGINAAWYYSTAPLLPAINPPTSVWEPRADYGPTNSEGVVGFAMSEDGKYWCDQGEQGPYGTWILAPGHPSDGLFGLGMCDGTDHRHLNLVFQVVAVEDDDGGNGEEPEDGDLSAVVEAIDRLTGEMIRAVNALEKIAGVFA